MRPLGWLLAVVLAVSTATSGPAAAASHSGEVVEATLANGLRVLLLEDRRSPIVSVQVWYRVGSRNEQPGATGLAHFLEHLMFKGTPTHGKGDFARLVEQRGGQHNAFTSSDVTSYFVNIVSDQLDLVLALEADRMRHLLLDPGEITAERQVVMEERRTRTEDDPDGVLSEELSAVAFKAHPYRWPIIGWMEDIARITPAELRAFYDRYYVPGNALLVVVGDISATAALARIRALFETIPPAPAPPPVAAVEPPQIGERRVVVRRRGAKLPTVAIAYHVPNYRSADAAALELLSTILSEGRASRLYRTLVYERQIALGAGGDYAYASFDPSLFWFSATALPGQSADTLERALAAEIERLRDELVPDEELARAKNQVEAAFVWRQDSVYSRASSLVRFEIMGSWRLLERFVPAIRTVTAEDLRRVARAYFHADNRSVGVLLPVEPDASTSP
jgi:zinc protease